MAEAEPNVTHDNQRTPIALSTPDVAPVDGGAAAGDGEPRLLLLAALFFMGLSGCCRSLRLSPLCSVRAHREGRRHTLAAPALGQEGSEEREAAASTDLLSRNAAQVSGVQRSLRWQPRPRR